MGGLLEYQWGKISENLQKTEKPSEFLKKGSMSEGLALERPQNALTTGLIEVFEESSRVFRESRRSLEKNLANLQRYAFFGMLVQSYRIKQRRAAGKKSNQQPSKKSRSSSKKRR